MRLSFDGLEKLAAYGWFTFLSLVIVAAVFYFCPILIYVILGAIGFSVLGFVVLFVCAGIGHITMWSIGQIKG